MKEMRRVLALALCLVMLVGILPVSAFAKNNKTKDDNSHKDKLPEKIVAVEDPVPVTTETVPPTEVTEAPEETVPVTTEETVSETTEVTVPATTEETVPATTEQTLPETTEETISEEITSGIVSVVQDHEVELIVDTMVTLEEPDEDDLTAQMDRAQAYVNYMMTQNDPESVVKTFGSHFTWDTEDRENDKPYLYDWSYYNGVVFEGLEYLYEITKNVNYKNYVVEYMSSLIAEDGTWAVCDNNSKKTCAGYNENHGVDTFKTASLLLDAYEMTGDSRYLTMAGTIAGHLETVAVTSDDIGGNYVHTWGDGGTPSYALWLDGLYMTLPFRAEYAKYQNETDRLQDIVDRLCWVSDNMYDSEEGLFYHAASSTTKNSGTFWLRSMGWYAAALADVMDSVDAAQRDLLASQLTKLADGLKAHYNKGGMWLNKVAADYDAEGNPYETSGTALIAYALLKAVNNGWIDDSYADMALTAFYTITNEKLNSANTVLTDICQKGAPTSSNSYFADNEGKGVGPYIMLYAEVMEYTDYIPTQPEEPEVTPPTDPDPEPEPEDVVKEDPATGVTVTAPGITDLTVVEIEEAAQVEQIQQKVAKVLKTENLVMLDISVEDFTAGSTATVVIPIPEGMDSSKFAVFYVPAEGELERMPGQALSESQYEFTTTHFSPYVGGEIQEGNNSAGSGQISGSAATVSTERATSISTGSYYVIRLARNNNEYYLANTNNTDSAMLDLVTSNEHYWYITQVAGGYHVRYGGPTGAYLTLSRDNASLTNTPTVLALNFSTYNSNECTNTQTFTIGLGGEYLNQSGGAGNRRAGGWNDATDPGSRWNLYPVNASGAKYVLDTNGMDLGERYIIVGDTAQKALSLSGTTVGNVDVTVTGDTVTVGSNASACEFYFVDNSAAENNTYLLSQNGTSTVYHSNGNMYYGTDNKGYWYVSDSDDGTYRVYDYDNNNWYLNYGYAWGSNETDSFAVSSTQRNVRLYKKVTTFGSTSVNFAISPVTMSMNTGEFKTVAYEITLGNGAAVTDCEITWTSSQNGYVYVNDYGEVEALAGDPNGAVATVTATLTSVNGMTLDEPITLTSTITVYSEEEAEDPEYGAEDLPKYPNEGAVQLSKVIGDAEYFQRLGVAEVKLAASGIPAKTYVDAVLTIDISNSMAWGVGSETDNFDENKLHHVMSSVEDFADILLAPNEDGTPSGNTITIVFFAGKDMEHWGGSSTNAQIDSVLVAGLRLDSVADVQKITKNTEFQGRDDSNEYVLKIAKLDSSGNLSTYSGQNRGDTNYDYAFWQTEQAVDSILAANANSETNREVHVLFMTDGCPTHFNNVYYNNGSVGNYYIPGSNTQKYSADGNFKNEGGEAWINWVKNSVTTNGGNTYAKRVFEKVTGLYAVGFDMEHGAFSGITHSWPTEGREAAFIEIVGSIVGRRIPVTNATDTDTLNAFYTSLAKELRVAASNAYFADQMSSSVSIQTASYITKFKGTTDEKTYALPADSLPKITIRTYDIVKKSDIGKTLNINGTNTLITAEHVGERYGDPTVLETVVFNATGTEAYSDVKGSYTGPTATTVEGITNVLSPDTMGQETETTASILTYSGSPNILGTDGIIYGEYFWYNTTGDDIMIDKDGNGSKEYKLEAETFCWNIGTISDEEFEMSYYVNLEGSAEGEAEAGVYKTNEYAKLYYTNYLGNDVHQSVPSPSLAWEGALVNYGLYLVDINGNVITDSATGATGNFVDREIILDRTLYQQIKYNDTADGTARFTVENTPLPKNYRLYDRNAEFHIEVDSALEDSYWTVAHGEGKKPTTYVTDYRGIEATTSNSENLTQTGIDYTSVTVWFAVVYVPDPEIKPDAVVIDYGIPVDISVLANDFFTGEAELNGIAKLDDKPDTGDVNYTTTKTPAFGTEYNGTYGKATVADNKVRYQVGSMKMPSFEKFSYEAKYEDPIDEGYFEYYYSDITVIPATTIYYEDNFLTFGKYRTADHYRLGDWETEGTMDKDAVQAEDRPGFDNSPDYDANNVYGYDGAYTEYSQFSLGSARHVNVDSETYATATFDFYGTGFDVISVTDNQTGVLVAQVYNDTQYEAYEAYVADRTKPVPTATKTLVVDTFYGYHFVSKDVNGDGTRVEGEGVWEVSNANDPNALYQVPVLQAEGLAYGHYHAVLTASYNAYLDHTTGNGYTLYLDAIRIYDPAGRAEDEGNHLGDAYEGTDDTIGNAYLADKEGYPVYEELRNKVITVADFSVEDSAANGVVYIDGGAGEAATMSDYTSYGPNNELYLEMGNAVAFNMDLSKYVQNGESIIDSVQIGLKCETKDQPVTVNIYNVGNADDGATLNTATDMYYDITAYATAGTPIVIKNQSGTASILSITNIKLTFTDDPADQLAETKNAYEGMPFGMRITADEAEAVVTSVNAMNGIPEDTTPDEDIPETSDPFVPEKMEVSLNKDSVKAGSKVAVTVTTSADVESVEVNGVFVTKYNVNKKTRERIWKQTVKAEEVGEMEIAVAAYNAEDLASEKTIKTVEVTGKTGSNKDKATGTAGGPIKKVTDAVDTLLGGLF